MCHESCCDINIAVAAKNATVENIELQTHHDPRIAMANGHESRCDFNIVVATIAHHNC